MIEDIAGAWGESHAGCRKKRNEDRFLIKQLEESLLLAVADGIGGHAGGEVAAEIVIDTFRDHRFAGERPEKDLGLALAAAEKRLRHRAAGEPALEGMGTTLTSAVIHRNAVHWIHVGDSRMYLLRGGKIKRITKDHTFIQDLVDDGTITPIQAERHPLKELLDQCVGCEGLLPEHGLLQMERGDRLLLCSDGLTKHLSDRQIEALLRDASAEEAPRELIRTALEMGGSDNVTAVVMEGR